MAKKQDKLSIQSREHLLHKLSGLIQNAHKVVRRHIDNTMTLTYFFVGRYIIEDEQQGQERATYADETLKYLGNELTQRFGRGFSSRNLASMKKFYLTYQTRMKAETILQIDSAKSVNDISNEEDIPILQNGSAKFDHPFPLSWSHYLILCRIDDVNERNFYEIEAISNHWKIKELERQFNSSLFERLVLSKNKKKVKELSERGLVFENPEDAIKYPLVLEFLGLKEEYEYSENELEAAIINKLEHFILELGKGFLFSGRQVRFTYEEEHYFVDLVFYHRILRCFVLIDLKIGKLKHQDIGQMQMYVNYYDRQVKSPDENKTIGIIICKDKKDAIVEMTLPEDNTQIFASKYQLYLPSKEALKKLIND